MDTGCQAIQSASPAEANAAHEIRSRQHLSTCWALSSVNREKACSIVFSTIYAELILALLILLERLL